MSVYICPGIRRMADGRRHAQSVSNMASCVCPGMRRPQGTARSCCFPTILFSFACRGIQDAHADRNNVPVSHTSRHGIWGPKLLPIILTGVAARAHHAPNVSPNMRRNMYLYATRRNPAWWGDTPRNRWNHAVFGLITRNPAGGTHGVLRMRRDSNSNMPGTLGNIDVSAHTQNALPCYLPCYGHFILRPQGIYHVPPAPYAPCPYSHDSRIRGVSASARVWGEYPP